MLLLYRLYSTPHTVLSFILRLIHSQFTHTYVYELVILPFVILNTNNKDMPKALVPEIVNYVLTMVIKCDTDQSACFISACSDLYINHVFNPSHVP